MINKIGQVRSVKKYISLKKLYKCQKYTAKRRILLLPLVLQGVDKLILLPINLSESTMYSTLNQKLNNKHRSYCLFNHLILFGLNWLIAGANLYLELRATRHPFARIKFYIHTIVFSTKTSR